MNKKNCCGCLGVGCLIFIVLAVVSTYFGFSSLHSSGKEYAAMGLEKSIEKITEFAFEEQDRAQLNKEAHEIASKIRSGEISLTKFAKMTGQQLEKNLHFKAILLAFAHKSHLSVAPVVDGQEASESAQTVKRLLYGVLEQRIPAEHLASITAVIVERYTETGADGQRQVSVERLKDGLSAIEMQSAIDLMKDTVELNNIGSPPEDFDAGILIKDDFLKFFKEMQEPMNGDS